MKIKIVKIGKSTKKEINTLVADYQKRLKSFAKIELIEFKDHDSSLNNNKSKTDQIVLDLKKKSNDFIVLLDERGKQFSSPGLAEFLEKQTDNPQVKSLAFIVGGAYGFSEIARNHADYIWSLSEGVFPNEIAWLVVWEQIYRAFNIVKGTPYHHV